MRHLLLILSSLLLQLHALGQSTPEETKERIIIRRTFYEQGFQTGVLYMDTMVNQKIEENSLPGILNLIWLLDEEVIAGTRIYRDDWILNKNQSSKLSHAVIMHEDYQEIISPYLSHIFSLKYLRPVLNKTVERLKAIDLNTTTREQLDSYENQWENKRFDIESNISLDVQTKKELVDITVLLVKLHLDLPKTKAVQHIYYFHNPETQATLIERMIQELNSPETEEQDKEQIRTFLRIQKKGDLLTPKSKQLISQVTLE